MKDQQKNNTLDVSPERIKVSLMVTVTVLLIAAWLTPPDEQTSEYVPFVDNGKWGVLNDRFEEVLPARFAYVSEIVDSLVACRKDGYYGVYNLNSRADVLPFEYDYIGKMQHGLIIAARDKVVRLFDTQGKAVYEKEYDDIRFTKSPSLIEVKTGDQIGLIDLYGRAILNDPVREVSVVNDTTVIVYGKNHYPYFRKDTALSYDVSVIDRDGRVLVPSGKYKELEYLGDDLFLGEFEVSSSGKYPIHSEVIDRNGVLQFKVPGDVVLNISNAGYHSRLIDVLIIGDTTDEYNSSVNYVGYVDHSGQVVASSTGWKNCSRFYPNGIAMVENRSDSSYLITPSGERVGDKFPFRLYQTSLEYPSLYEWYDNQSMVSQNGNYQLIKADGSLDERPLLEEGENWRFRLEGRYKNYGLFEKDMTDLRSDYRTYAVYDLTTREPLVNGANAVNRHLFTETGILVYEKDERTTYHNLNRPEQPTRTYEQAALPELDLDYQLASRISSTASSRVENTGSKSDLALAVITDCDGTFDGRYAGNCLTIANYTPDTITFDAQDRRLYARTEVLHDGHWLPLESLDNSWCGNSYHQSQLPPLEEWKQVIPRYAGALTGDMRVRLEGFEDPEESVVSNVFRGHYNPAQLWRSIEYSYAPLTLFNWQE